VLCVVLSATSRQGLAVQVAFCSSVVTFTALRSCTCQHFRAADRLVVVSLSVIILIGLSRAHCRPRCCCCCCCCCCCSRMPSYVTRSFPYTQWHQREAWWQSSHTPEESRQCCCPHPTLLPLLLVAAMRQQRRLQWRRCCCVGWMMGGCVCGM
jgi:hypothetical protein